MLTILEIIRLEEGFEKGTVGVLRINKEVFCYTLEPFDEENQRNVSSIPAQQYICKPYSSQRFPNTYEITDVPGRSHVLFHGGHLSKGCIILFDTIPEFVLRESNTSAFKRFMEKIRTYEKLHLTIKENY